MIMVKIDELVRRVRAEDAEIISAKQMLMEFFLTHPNEVYRKEDVVKQFKGRIPAGTVRITITNLSKKGDIGHRTIGVRKYYGCHDAIKNLEESLPQRGA